MIFFVSFSIALLAALFAYVTLCPDQTERIRVFRKADPDANRIQNDISLPLKIVITGVVFIISFWEMFMIQNHVFDKLNIFRMAVPVVLLPAAGCVDLREFRIPNFFPIVIASSGLCVLGLGLLTDQPGANGYLVSCVFAAVCVVVLLSVASFLTKQGMGIGDIKLLGALALIGGVYTIAATVFFAISACALITVFLIITKKKTAKESLPFGPFIWGGYAASILLSIY